MRFPFYKQLDTVDCGPTCLRMIAKYYGRSYSLQYLRQKCQIQRFGVSLLSISESAEAIGLRTLAVKIDYEALLKKVTLPCIIHWDQKHFVVVIKVTNVMAHIADPAAGLRKIPRKEFEKHWTAKRSDQAGIALLLEPTATFLNENDQQKDKLDVVYVFRHISKHRKLFFQVILGIISGLVLQLILPFMTQSVIDVGIASKDLNFITLILIGQIMIFLGSSIVDFIRSWIMLHISTRINIGLLTEFLIKLMRLPMSYFDVKQTGDIMQRMEDHSRVQTFFTNTLLNTSFSLISFVIFTLLAITYDVQIFFVFIIGSILYFVWILLFLRFRRNLDFRKFELSTANQNAAIEMIQGMQEIKLNNCEKQKRWTWERIQARLFKINMRTLFINQIQSTGALFINQGKNVFISYLSARAVVNGEFTLGEMMAIQTIVGQLNNPMQQIIQFVQSLQDTRISLERINEVQQMDNEEPNDVLLNKVLPPDKTINISDLNYKYPGYSNETVLKNINLTIPEGKITAIVGMSGSGKTTLLKLLLRYYNIEEGLIKIGSLNMNSISPSLWRSKCGVVMQESFIFSDTIAANIAIGEDYPDEERLRNAVTIANLHDFLDNLPLGINTKIGTMGSGISQGQKQRILIARAIYKDPDYIFFDEATNSLDANNESTIMNNLHAFFKGKTVIIVAHRLSTVKHADNIIVLDRGTITESGTHGQLTEYKGSYYKLVRNQLEVGT